MKKILVLMLGLHLYLLFNLRFTLWPEMLSYPYLANNGFKLYGDMIMPYPPFLILGLQLLYKLFGYNLWIIKIFSWTLIIISDLLLFYITKSLTKADWFAFVSLATYVFLQPFLDGNMIWFDNVVVLPILVGLLFLLQKKYFRSGIALTIAMFIKQTAGIFLVLSILYLALNRKQRNIPGLLIFPALLGTIFLAWLFLTNSLNWFLNWIFLYPMTQWGSFPGYLQFKLTNFDKEILFLLIFPVLLLRNRLLWLYLIGGLVSIYPRFSFFHFQTALAVLAIAYGVILSKSQNKYLLLAPVLAIILVIKQIFPLEWQKEARFYSANDLQTAGLIQAKTSVNESIYLLGLDSSLYALNSRLPTKPWFDNFGWYLEIEGEQEVILNKWEINPPDYVIWRVPKAGNWFDLGTYQPQKITNWIELNYTKGEEVKPGIFLWKKSI